MSIMDRIRHTLIVGVSTLLLTGGVSAQKFEDSVSFELPRIERLVVEETREVFFTFDLAQAISESFTKFWISSKDEYIATNYPNSVNISEAQVNTTNPNWGRLSFNITGGFLGYTDFLVTPEQNFQNGTTRLGDTVSIAASVVRKPRVIDQVFTHSVIVLVCLIYINFGAALDVPLVKKTLKRPIGPAIGFVTQFVLMPLLSYGLAKALIPLPALQLGLFITGCSPGGGASNIWTLTLGGNMDLSITMTSVSTFSAFFMMPFWVLTLGATIFDEANLGIPYARIANYAIALVVPLAIGIFVQYKLPRVRNILVKIIKPFSILLIVFIVVFAIVTNLYLFELFTWQILVSGALLPWLGYILGGGMGWLMRQEWKDIVAIGIETGVQNTGLAILALRFSLPQPEADLTTALPVAVAIMTPILPVALMVYQKVTGKGKDIQVELESKGSSQAPIGEKASSGQEPMSYGTYDNTGFEEIDTRE